MDTQAQLTHDENRFSQHTFPLIVVCDSISFLDNIGSLFRICEAMGVEKIIFFGEGLDFNLRKINKTSRSTHKQLSYEVLQHKKDLLEYLKSNEFEIIALEITDQSIPLQSLQFKTSFPKVLLIGNEITGISDDVLQLAQQTVHITMFGANSSMNVVQAASIALYEMTNQL
ncbi:TrmH family RNA methyltransferase [Flavobacterium sp. '19STA2R22 D10 B1']|uniref:TrmH family RNA methyltransferase n=1 Tax=Flavobacterium aerium TaxID=3037261 RepID=UPI00278C5D0E|nr:TrmH family RNA methyltransferase [Flavobacterium sp. '19STA2R22 D10 B1']